MADKVVGGAPGFDITSPTFDYEKGPFKLIRQSTGKQEAAFKTLEEAVQEAVRLSGEAPRRSRTRK